ncbi:MAG: hypothetical protein KDJ19_13385 [Hyphomicrobiaceae bacterium]|nr:hypothetical protein [Hyphomicrobiaceae bacterium]
MNAFPKRLTVLMVLTLLAAALLLLAVLYAALKEAAFSNSYALLADAFLHGKLDVAQCFDTDCAVIDGKTYVMFPPLPGLIALPFVAMFGLGFKGFVLLGLAFAALSTFFWADILDKLLGGNKRLVVWMLVAIAFASPLYYVTIRSDGVWFFAQSTAFFFVSAAIHFALIRKWLIWAGLAIGLAFLCRQMSIFYLPFLFVLTLSDDAPLFRFDGKRIWAIFKMGLPAAALVLAYLVYNYVRFGAFGSTGYEHMNTEAVDLVMSTRLTGGGLFSLDFGLFNLLYLLFQGFHVQFSGDGMLDLAGIDPFGTSLLAASPFVLFAFFAPNRREIWIGLATIIIMVVPMLFYHSNGFSQYNVQRYTLDWLPILFVILGRTLPVGKFESFPLFVSFGVVLNVVTIALLAITT